VVLQIDDEGQQTIDKKYFEDKKKEKDGIIKLTRTSEEDGHDHSWTMDENGDGKTSTENGHSHKIIAYEIIPKDDGHTHQLPLGAR
jgi:hypothetical protein